MGMFFHDGLGVRKWRTPAEGRGRDVSARASDQASLMKRNDYKNINN